MRARCLSFAATPLVFLVGCAQCGTTEPPHADKISTPTTEQANESLIEARETVRGVEPPLKPGERREVRSAAEQSLEDARRALVRMDRRLATLRQQLERSEPRSPELVGLVDSAARVRDQLARRIATMEQAGIHTYNEANLQVENAIDTFDETYFRAMQVMSQR